MNTVIFHVREIRHQQNYAKLLASGMMKIDPTLDIKIGQNHFDSYNPPDLLITWSHKYNSHYNIQKEHGKKYMVMERAYLGDRHHWVSLGYGGLNGNANFYNKDAPSDRWNYHFSHLKKEWKTNIDDLPILLIGQVPGDASHSHINIQLWYQQAINYYNSIGKKVIFRKHPLDKTPRNNLSGNFEFDKFQNIEDSLNNCCACITFSSNVGVLSLIAGVPTVACDTTSMVYNHVGNQLSDYKMKHSRDKFYNEIAYAQWLPSEVEDGTAWKHLKIGMGDSWHLRQ